MSRLKLELVVCGGKIRSGWSASARCGSYGELISDSTILAGELGEGGAEI
jgi:hypothetical protein